MSNPTDIISSLQNILFMQNEYNSRNNINNPDNFVDVPVVDDDEYKTHTSLDIMEQEEDEEEEAAVEDPAAGGGEVDMGGDMGGEADMGGGDMGGDMGGMPGEEKEEPLTPGQIGRVYELKKIYTRLSALENMLQDVTETEMIELRNLISKTIDIFKTLSSNFDIYKDKLDDIIIIFYKFLDISYKKVRDYFKNNRDNEG